MLLLVIKHTIVSLYSNLYSQMCQYTCKIKMRKLKLKKLWIKGQYRNKLSLYSCTYLQLNKLKGRGGGYIWKGHLFDILAPGGRCLIGGGHLLECGRSQYIKIENGLATAHLPCCCCLFIRTNSKFILVFAANFKLCCCIFCAVTLNTNHIHEKKIIKHNTYEHVHNWEIKINF